MDAQYAISYLWHFQDGVPGQAVRGFVCLAALPEHAPFTGTLRNASA